MDPENEIEDLHQRFRSALDRPQQLEAMGRAGRRYLGEHHRPELYARELMAGIETAIDAPASIVPGTLAPVAELVKKGGLNDYAKWALANRTSEEIRQWLSADQALDRAARRRVHLSRDST